MVVGFGFGLGLVCLSDFVTCDYCDSGEGGYWKESEKYFPGSYFDSTRLTATVFDKGGTKKCHYSGLPTAQGMVNCAKWVKEAKRIYMLQHQIGGFRRMQVYGCKDNGSYGQ